MNQYEDIINMPHHVSKNHPQMSIQNRAAQFSPFAALTGYDDAIDESSRLTEAKKILTEDKMEQINNTLTKIEQDYQYQTLCHITYFLKDNKKKGGKYIDVIDRIIKIDKDKRTIHLKQQKTIAIDDIYDITFC